MALLKGKKVALRPLEVNDLDLLYEWENNPHVWGVSNTITPYSRYELEQYIAGSSADIYASKQLRLVIVNLENNKEVGLIDLFDFDPFNSKVGVGILVADTANRNKGFAKESITLMMDYVGKHLGLKQLYCNITQDNTASISLFEDLGFNRSGVKKKWIRVEDTWLDELLFQHFFQ